MRAPVISLARVIDRWIFVFTAASFILLALLGFIPDSISKIAAVNAGERAPFPPILHVHAVLMGSFLLLLLAQTTLAATGRLQYHRRLGLLGAAFVPAIVVTGFLLVPAMYQQVWSAAQNAPPEAREKLEQVLLIKDDIMLGQLRQAVLFPLFMVIALMARKTDSGLHKRMMILAIAMILPAAIDRISWLPTTFPASPLGADLYTLLAVMPMFIWDLARNRSIPKAYVIWLTINVPFALAVHSLWGSPWWHSVAPRLVMS
ncbi:MAG: hypothetical protein KGQ42_04160 [Alphaproteobacteria bacterium]|nr:hypothetical protein [Alphaproteobacteria bacterium]MDE2042256.1 hypothetical protein [Alphaproteobacteria bacterium]MDE2340625.1 hypothetical protein [Alphaproteobacteria bacterium]